MKIQQNQTAYQVPNFKGRVFRVCTDTIAPATKEIIKRLVEAKPEEIKASGINQHRFCVAATEAYTGLISGILRFFNYDGASERFADEYLKRTPIRTLFKEAGNYASVDIGKKV